jgi:DNA polymerase-1
MSYRTWDIETTVHTRFKRKANAYIPENWVVTHGVKGAGEKSVTEYRFGHDRPPPGWFKPVLLNADGSFIKLLIGMNIKFDIQHALQDTDNLLLWMEFVSRGGIVWDIQLAEYLLNGQAQDSQMLSLNEISARYGGDQKVDEVKLLWEAGVMTEDIEPELLTRYLCGGLDENLQWSKGDVENTEHVALQQITLARERGQLPSIMLNMGALLYTVEAERNGMWVDTVQGMMIADTLRVEVQRLGEALKAFMPTDLPFEFNWNSPPQKSALIFGGTVNYDHYEYDLADGTTMLKKDYDLLLSMGDAPARLYASKKETHYLLADGRTMAVDWFDHCMWTEWKDSPKDQPDRVAYVSGKNAGEYKTKQVTVPDLTKPKGRQVKAPYTFKGYTTPLKKWESEATPGVYSTATEVIEELASRNVPFLKLMGQLQAMSKDLGTYFIGQDKSGNPSGMLTLVGPDGLVHHMLNMVSTITARLSSSNPNLQNIPKGNKSDVKLLFKSRFGHWVHDDFGNLVWYSEGKIIQSDFSSLEVYVQAILTGCKQLIADLAAGLDMHCVRLAAKEKMEYAEVLKLAKGYKDESGTFHAPVKEWDYKRTGAKEYSFQSAFGAGDKAIAEKTGMDIEDVARLRAADEERYPEIPSYYKRITLVINENRVPYKVVDHPEVRGVKAHLGKSHFRTPDGKMYTYMQTPAPEYQVKRGITATFMPTEIKNYVVQGTGGEWAKAAMYLALRAFYKRKNFGGLALLVNQVHDATYADAHNSVAFEAAALLHAAMEGASDYMAWKFKWNIPLRVPSDTSWGYSMMDEEPIEGLKERAAVLRKELQSEYMDGFTPSYLN